MIVEERMRTYTNSLDMGNTSFLEELERKALLDRVPIIRKEMQSFLKMFLAATRPQTILEVGTAVGFSTLLMCEYGPADLKGRKGIPDQPAYRGCHRDPWKAGWNL